MAKLSEDILDEGRKLLRDKETGLFFDWVNTHAAVFLTQDFRKTFTLIIPVDPEKAVKLFDKLFPDHDPAQLVHAALKRLTLLIVVGLGILGGLAYLLKLIL